MSNVDQQQQSPPTTAEPALTGLTMHRIARLILYSFLLTFLCARVMVLLIMTKRVPTLYLHVGGTHVHHLNYGIFLLSGVGAYLLLRRPVGARLAWSAVIYGIGLGLTFDEFGMWVHLGGPYWQRASFDAVVVIAAILTLFVEAPRWRRLERRHFVAAVLVGLCFSAFAYLLIDSVRKYAHKHISPVLEEIEANGPQ
jgi:hypothetical protein